MSRILAIDYGTKRVGIAVTDPLQIIAGALDTVPTHTLLTWLKQYLAENSVCTIVLGKPTQMNGEPSQTFAAIEQLFAKLKKLYPTVNIEYCDERFTSVLAHRAIIDGGVKKKQRRDDKGLVDRVSATIILQSYLESSKFKLF